MGGSALHKCTETALTGDASLSEQLLQSVIVKISLISISKIYTAIKGVLYPFLVVKMMYMSN